MLALQSSPASVSIARLSRVWTRGGAACWQVAWQRHLGCNWVDCWLFLMKCLKLLISQSQQNHVFSALLGKCMAALASCTWRIFVIRKQASCVLLWIREKATPGWSTTASWPAVCCHGGCHEPHAADGGCVSVCIRDSWCWWLWCGWSWSASYRTVLSVSRSQSLGRGRVPEETATSCCSTASSGTRARLSPLKDIAGSTEEAKITKKVTVRSFWSFFFVTKQPEIFKPAKSEFALCLT